MEETAIHTQFIINALIIIGLALFVLLTAAAYTVYAERKVAAAIQQRVGPNRVGPFGLLQPLADVIKLLLKEDIVPVAADKFVHFIAPVISVSIALITMAVIPFARAEGLAFTEGTGGYLMIADVNIGILYILAVTSISVYGVTLAGWSSNSKYSLLGGLRASAQMISYELAMGLAVVSVILLTNANYTGDGGFLKLTSIVEAQREFWNIFINPLGFIIFVTAAFAEANRTPFDLVEAEQELVGGFHTEYSSMKFALFFVAEYIHVIVASALITTLFLGGYLGPFEGAIGVAEWSPLWQLLWGLAWFSAKTLFFVFVFLWVRWTIPRFKYNQLMDYGWKRFLPLAIINLMLVALGIAIFAS
ncbi:MAG: NADH-quinone oxidoreductase subunit NuoH [Bacteroidetes bacterium]|nr:MAG: NADH-quinone oxidoreductase subunit NuoH [Bacteroidota bacterium]